MIRSRDYIGFLAPSALLPRRSGSRRVRVFPIASLFLRGLTVPLFRVLTLATLSLVLLAGPGVVDVSEAAAKELDFIKEGITQVRIEEVPGPFDPRYLDFIYPKIPYLEIDRIKSESNFH